MTINHTKREIKERVNFVKLEGKIARITNSLVNQAGRMPQ